MKLFVVAGLMFFVGILLGRLAPQSELDRLHRELEERGDAPQRGVSTLDPLSSVFAEVATPGKAADANVVDSPAPASVVSEGTPPRSESDAESGAPEEVDDDSLTDLERRIEAATEVWDLRKGVVRQGFIDRVGINEDELIVFDTAIDAMNLRLGATFEKWAQLLESTDIPPAELGVKMGHEITEMMSLAYDDLDRGMPAGWRDASGENFSMGDFIDPTVAMPLLSVEDKLRGLGRP